MISVLLVEDEPDVLEITRLFLERDKEIQVDPCNSVKEALQKLNNKIYDVIITDYLMPEIDGIQLLKTIKLQGIDTPVIIFTGKGREETAIDALNSGAAFYLQKGENPRFQFAKLRKLIHEAALKQKVEDTYRENNICVVVPAHNEEKLIGATLASVPDYIIRIYAVDDASTDRTSDIIREYVKRDSRIMHIRHDKNKGVGAAIVSGYIECLKESMDIAVVMAGDNQMDPKYLPNLLDPIIKGQADYVVGNRLLGPEYRKGMSRWRFFGNATLTLLTKIASGYWQLMDPQNGYTAISRTALERIDLNRIYPGYGYCNDILVKLNTYSFRVKNAPHPSRYGTEVSGIRYRTYIIRLSRLLFRDFLWRMKAKYVVLNFHPLVFFYFFGSISILLSILMGIYALYYKFVQLNAIFVPAVFSIILFFIGGMFLSFAMLFDMEQEKTIGM